MASGQPASGEDSLIARYFRPLATDPGAFGLDDDAAALKPDGDDIVVTTDAIVEGVHFLPDDPPDTVARKALRVNLSRSRGQGRHAGRLRADAGAAQCRRSLAQAVRGGAGRGCHAVRLSAAGRRHGFDAGPADGLGHRVRPRAAGQDGSSQRGQARRARDGDGHDRRRRAGACHSQGRKVHAAATDTAAREALVGRYRVPQPRVAMAEIVRDHASAAMDVSDGLAGDLAKLCGVSGVSAVIDLAVDPAVGCGDGSGVARHRRTGDVDRRRRRLRDPVHARRRTASRRSRKPREHAGVAVSSIGTVVAGSAAPKFIDGQGREIALERLLLQPFLKVTALTPAAFISRQPLQFCGKPIGVSPFDYRRAFLNAPLGASSRDIVENGFESVRSPRGIESLRALEKRKWLREQ